MVGPARARAEAAAQLVDDRLTELRQMEEQKV
jgi:hypothetical protein